MSARPIVGIAPLHNGDHLTLREYMRRYQAMPEHVRAELINGVVYMASPVRAKYHGTPHSDIDTWLGTYRARTPGVDGSIGPTLLLSGANAPEPDCCLYITPDCGGRAQTDDEGYLSGSPELIVEVAASSASFDLHDKLRQYERNGVQEYLVWRVLDKVVEWFALRVGGYKRMTPSPEGYLKSKVLPGLWLSTVDLTKGNLERVLRVLRKGLTSPEHKRFVERLVKAKLRRNA